MLNKQMQQLIFYM